MAALWEKNLRTIRGDDRGTARQSMVAETDGESREAMNFPRAVASGFRKFFRFSGRASRSEYWYWVLFIIAGRLLFQTSDAVLFNGSGASPLGEHPLDGMFALVTLVPSIAVAVRRLHDVDRRGWWLLTYFTIIGAFYPLLVWKCTKGSDGANRFGPDPLGIDANTVEIFA
jgi:uncharacterized membrane protein YhaH (DUF805 family)